MTDKLEAWVTTVRVDASSLKEMLDENKHLRAQVTALQADQTAQLKAARAAAWAMAADEADRVGHLLNAGEGDQGAHRAASAIRRMASHASVGAIPMVLDCPKCHCKHVDEGEWATTRVHREHLCALCGHVWRPCNVPTLGVEALP
jgi:hypothetical protein